MKNIYIFLVLLVISLSCVSCKKEQKEDLLCSCFIFSESNPYCSYYLSINKQGFIEITNGACNYEGFRLYFDGEKIEPSKYNLIESMGIVDSIYDFKSHKWEFYSYNGFLCAKDTLSHKQLNVLKNILSNINRVEDKSVFNQRKCDNCDDIPGFVLIFNGKIHTFWEEEADSYERAFLTEIRNFSAMPILMKPKADCVSGEGSQTKSIIEKVE
jgi:hypothetical protein